MFKKDRGAMNLAKFAMQNAAVHPNRPAVSVGHAVYLTHFELANRVRSLAGALRDDYGLQAGDRVAILLPNCEQYIEILISIWHAGLVAVPVDSSLNPKELSCILLNCSASVCFCSDQGLASLKHLSETVSTQFISVQGQSYLSALSHQGVDIADVGALDPAWIFYTSGTTGLPKGVTLTHRNLLAMTLAYFADIDRVSHRDVVIHVAPLSHGSGLNGLSHLVKGGNQVIPRSGRFDPEDVASLLRVYSGVTMFVSPTMLRKLARSPAMARTNLNNLKSIIYGGAPMYREVLTEAMDVFGNRLTQVYGQGEASMTITALHKDDHFRGMASVQDGSIGYVGYVRTGIDVKIVDDAGNAVPNGSIGEVIVRGDVVMSGYWQNPEATQSVLRDGWLYTGDMGLFNEEAILTLVDRSKDVIISGGSNIYPREIEEVLLHHPGVLDVSVIGRPDEEWGESVVAFIVPKKEQVPLEQELTDLCLSSLARSKRPKEYKFVESIPYNAYGKVSKIELRKLG